MRQPNQCLIFAQAVAAICLAPLMCLGQGTFTVTFDGPLLPAPGQHSTLISGYSESGMEFFVGSGNGGFYHAGADYSASYPYNGTPYLQGSGNFGYGSVDCDSYGRLFGVSSIDIAGYGNGLLDFDVSFYGFRSDRTILTANFSGSGMDFQTFHFGSEWSSGLVEFGFNPNLNGAPSAYAWSVDNLVVIVPEPATGALLLVGGIAGLLFCERKPRE